MSCVPMGREGEGGREGRRGREGRERERGRGREDEQNKIIQKCKYTAQANPPCSGAS